MGLESETLDELLYKLSALDLISFEKDAGVYHVKVFRPKSVYEVDLHVVPSSEILKHNCQEDIRAYGLVRSIYADSIPEIYGDDVYNAVMGRYEDRKDLTKAIKSYTRLNPRIARLNDPSLRYNVVCRKVSFGSWPRAEIVFNNGALALGFPQRLVDFFKKTDKYTPLVIGMSVDYYINKDNDLAVSMKITSAETR
jgi:hypothetical protein